MQYTGAERPAPQRYPAVDIHTKQCIAGYKDLYENFWEDARKSQQYEVLCTSEWVDVMEEDSDEQSFDDDHSAEEGENCGGESPQEDVSSRPQQPVCTEAEQRQCRVDACLRF